MKQQDFENRYQTLWQQLEQFFAQRPKANKNKKTAQPVEINFDELNQQLPDHYRLLCHHLALAKHRRYSPSLVDRLNNLVVDCHNLLYSTQSRMRYRWFKFFIVDFPQTLHRNRHFVRLATFLFLAPALVIGLLCYFNPDMIYTVMGWQDVRGLENMYDPANRVLGRARDAGSDMQMFGFYINNNIGIAFRTFAGGVLFGIGALFFIIYNGVMLGAVFGHLTQVGYVETFYPFVIGHGSFELTAIVLSGAAGLKLGSVLLDPRNYRRSDALKLAARDVIQIVLGAGAMLLIAAFIEAFWSSKASLPISVKLGVGTVLWILVLGYLGFAGRRYRFD